ncbi:MULTISPECIES: lipoprotein NlpI [Alteromonas]|jgi:lipoprotein NlpI|uniref:Lipoprotein NlpI n=1 Tax=Alteromonas mediterranea (strain DSM 17117 / CIP 110805 / LMG 28347 / Deep ecotype) TaxID=1774373 RepID=F2GBA2_ALTMD|nr:MULTISPECIES: lipoprotein NlpI [Alteromonas]MBR9785767.1 lipoprotein NlpI [Gammaproteobacteria bacterium]MEA3379277.1 lipoprotein NlpI [Pseudomonadota bacterium]AEA98008.1 lipoprotein NlpI [Alteromonas mediterranea DE]MBR9895756.1 lipoprotein NlpI [Gammaproteobacteria bacterium]NQY16665.1 lipoprotein NlpI [Alteromonas sp.]
MCRNVSLIFFSLFAAILTGCAQTPPVSERPQMGNLLLAEPAPVNPRSEMAIVRYNQVLTSPALSDEDKAELHFQRGMLYDSVGLPGLAQFDYTQAINFKPDLAEAYNSMGIHYIQQSDFIQAYDAFDSTLEINPEYDFAFLNRGIALYYGGRAELATNDLNLFFEKDDSDPFRALWAYFAHHDVSALEGQTYLASIRPTLDNEHWATTLVDLFLGTVTENDVLNSLLDGVKSQKALTDRLCEAYFYLGKFHMQQGNSGVASNYFKLALSTNVFDYVEHRYARMELNRLRDRASSAPVSEE